MTPQEYVEQVRELLASGRDQEALDFSERWWPTMAPQMSSEQIILVADWMHMVQMSVDLQQASLTPQDAEPVPSQPPTP